MSTRSNLNGGRAVRFQEWIDDIVPGRRPALNFKHTLMPHVPWQYLPSGKRYRKAPNDVIPGLSNQSFEDTGQLNVLLQRHFLQTGFADLELQHLWKHLKDDGLWDDSLIVVAADHGVAFPHARERRRLNRENAAEIAPVPLFIKAPGQKKGKTDDAWVETIDILPTIFDVLNLDPRVKMDGRSAFSDEVQNRDELRILIRNSFEVLRIPADTFTRERRAIIDRNQRLFGSGADGPGRIYEIGPHPELIGQPASAAGERARRGPLLQARLPERGRRPAVRPRARGGAGERAGPPTARHRGGRERHDPRRRQHLQARGGRRRASWCR